jgi:predicted acylesterase/phospholipase RssA
MGTKNFLFLVSILAVLNGCQTIANRSTQVPPLVPIQSQIPTDQSFPQTLPQTTTPPVQGNPLNVGVFLGPGAMRSYAHIGVLRALQRAQIPIVVIGGMEWGSIIGASFALSKGANEVEWEMMKLKKEQLPSSTLLSRDLKPKDSQDLFNFLSSAFASKDLASGNIPFRCATTDGDQVEFISQGKAREQLVKCAALPPLYSFYERAGKSYISGALSPGDWPGELRKLGAQFIVYVDVVSRGNIMTDKRYTGDSELKALWLAVRATSRQQHLFANFTIEIPSDMDLSDYDHRRDAIALGEQAALNSLGTIKQAIGVH